MDCHNNANIGVPKFVLTYFYVFGSRTPDGPTITILVLRVLYFTIFHKFVKLNTRKI